MDSFFFGGGGLNTLNSFPKSVFPDAVGGLGNQKTYLCHASLGGGRFGWGEILEEITSVALRPITALKTSYLFIYTPPCSISLS